MKRECGADEEAESLDLGEADGSKLNSENAALTSPTLKKDVKKEKDAKKEIKTEHRDPAHRAKELKVAESEVVRELKAQLK